MISMSLSYLLLNKPQTLWEVADLLGKRHIRKTSITFSKIEERSRLVHFAKIDLGKGDQNYLVDMREVNLNHDGFECVSDYFHNRFVVESSVNHARNYLAGKGIIAEVIFDGLQAL
jgi:hypothetical protein